MLLSPRSNVPGVRLPFSFCHSESPLSSRGTTWLGSKPLTYGSIQLSDIVGFTSACHGFGESDFSTVVAERGSPEPLDIVAQ